MQGLEVGLDAGVFGSRAVQPLREHAQPAADPGCSCLSRSSGTAPA
jgi:hypothetical protein